MEGKSGFSPPPPVPPLCWQNCAHTRVCVCVCEALGTPGSLLCTLSSLPTHTRPSLLPCDHSGHSIGQHLDQMMLGANKARLLSLWRQIFFTYYAWGKGTSKFILDFDRVGNGAANQTEMICNQGFLGV